MDTRTLFVYMFFYFSLAFLYIIHVLTLMLLIAPAAVMCLVVVFTAISTLVIKATADFGVDIRSFFVYSTLFNAALVLGFVVSVTVTAL